MRRKLTSTRLLKLGSIATMGMLFQTAGCAPDLQGLANTFTDLFASFLISTVVGNLFGTSFGFGF